MDSRLKLPVTEENKSRILQITDTHLFAHKGEKLLGVNTWMSYDAVLDTLVEEDNDYDLIVVTGYLVHDNSSAAYRYFAEGISRLLAPCVWLTGNHDCQSVMFSTLTGAQWHNARHVLLGQCWQVVLLDSQLSGMAHGWISYSQTEWLDQTLALQPQRHTLILLHHHPLPSGCRWLDEHRYTILESVLMRYPLAKTLLCGHIHQELDIDWNGRRVLATPSTCVQFKSHSTTFSVDSLAPGWRERSLFADGQV